MRKLRFKEFKQVVLGHTTSKGVAADLVPGHLLICAHSPHCVMLAKRTISILHAATSPRADSSEKEAGGGAGVRCKDP